MAKNPFFSNKTSPNGATAPNDSLNESYKRYFRGYNKFNLTRPLFQTERYADINLIEAVEGVEGDKLNFASKHSIRSYTLKAPVEFELYKKKTTLRLITLLFFLITGKRFINSLIRVMMLIIMLTVFLIIKSFFIDFLNVLKNATTGEFVLSL